MLTSFTRNRLLLSGGGILAAAALLASGIFIGDAMADDNSDDPADDSPVAVSQDSAGSAAQGRPDFASGRTAPGSAPAAFEGDSESAEDSDFPRAANQSGGWDAYYGSCEGSIDGLATGSGLDLSGTGLTIDILPSPYALHSISLRAQHDCMDESDQWLVLDTSWSDAAGEYTFWISQREAGEPVANVLRGSSAEFWRDGYAYSVSVGYSYKHDYLPVEPFEGDILPPREYDETELRAQLESVLAVIAPDIDQQCFYRQSTGDWSALSALGIGDPRGAIPSGFTEDGFWAEVYDAPVAGCDNTAEFNQPLNFNANWSNGSDGWIGLNAWAIDGDFEEPWLRQGYASDENVYWTTGTIRFEVYGSNRSGGIGLDTLEAIARAMDPAYDQSCRLVERDLTDDELRARGIGVPTAPDGFDLDHRRATASEGNANCGSDIVGQTSADWSFSGPDGANLNANAWHNPEFGPEIDPGFIEKGYLAPDTIGWYGENGTNYSVSLWSDSYDGLALEDSEAILIEVALSMDPTLNIDDLIREDGFPRPMPVDDIGVAEPAPEPAFR